MITLSQAIEQIKKANPVFGAFLDSKQKVLEYSQQKITSYKPSPIHKERQKGYLQEIKNEVARLFPTGEVKVNFDEELILDTSDHHNILNFPATIGSHLMTRFDTLFAREKYGDFFVLDTSNVPFTEVLHKRGVEFSGRHINLFPKTDRSKLTSHYPLFKFDLVKSAMNSGHQFSSKEYIFLKNLNEKINNIDLSNCRDFSDQIVKVNLVMWQEFFSENDQTKVRKCLTLDHNRFLIRFIKKFLLEQKENFIWQALFNESFRVLVMKEFSGIYGAWDYEKKGTGTHFFWGITPKKQMTALFLKDNFLHDRSNCLPSIPMTPEGIVEALEKNQIVPSIFTKFGLVAFYLGTQVMGGPGQSEYVPKLKEAWLRVLQQADTQEVELVRRVPADIINTMDTAFYKNSADEIIKGWGFDMAFRKILTEDYLKKVGDMPMCEVLRPFIPLSYYRLTPAAERQKIDFKEADLYSGFSWVK